MPHMLPMFNNNNNWNNCKRSPPSFILIIIPIHFKQLANAAAAQQLPSGLTIQTALAAAAAAAATPSASILPSPNSATAAQLAAAIPNLSSDLIYQAALLAAANTIG